MKRLKANKLIKPNYNKPNIIDLLRTTYNYCGSNFKSNKNIQYFKKEIKYNKHIIFILVDGLGYNQINKLDKHSILKTNLKTKVNTVFPSATGCVLNSVITGRYPSETGLYGWYGYHRETKTEYYTLLLNDRKTNENLSLEDKDIFKYDTIFNKFNREVNVVFPNFLVNSRYSKHVIGNNKAYGYTDYNNAFNIIKNIIKEDKETFTYLYLPEIDTLEHKNGLYNNHVKNQIKLLENALEDFIYDAKNFEIILTADHGQVDINEIVTYDYKKYKKYFYASPSIDLGTATFFVKEEYKKEFIKEFNKDFKNSMLLYSKEELIKNEFFGKNISEYAKSCLGEYISICKKGYAFYNRDVEFKKEDAIKGNHTGLTKEEMEIPLIVIEKKC